MAEQGKVRMRLVRDSDAPPSPDGSAFVFGLQDNKGALVQGQRGADGRFSFDFELSVKGDPAAGAPVFTGRFASGPPAARVVSLSWQRAGCGSYINRIKARLADIDWALLRRARNEGKRLEGDMCGRKAGGGTTPVAWRLVEP